MDTHGISVIDITPDKRLIPTLGKEGYTFPQALSELVDNAIDSFYLAPYMGDKLNITIRLSDRGNFIEVIDDAAGMDLKQLENGMRIAFQESTKKKRLGLYGIGLKSACSALGGRFVLITTARANPRYCFEYVEEEWLKNSNLTWTEYPIRTLEKITDGEHGTLIRIENLKVKIYPYRISQLQKDFSRRYAPYLRQNVNIKIQDDTREVVCKPEEYDEVLIEKIPIDITIPSLMDSQIKGWVGIMRESSQRGLYGIHLFRQGRLVDTYNKELLRITYDNEKEEFVESIGHPTVARIIGELSMDVVPVTFNKRQFVYESEHWEIVKKAVLADRNFQRAIRESRELANRSSNTSVLSKSKLAKLNVFTSQLIFSAANFTNPSIQLTGDIPSENKTLDFWELQIGTRLFKVRSTLAHLDPSDKRYSYNVSNNGEIEITTNTGSYSYLLTKDKPFYIITIIAECLAIVMAKEKGYSLDDSLTIRDELIQNGSKLMLELEKRKKGYTKKAS
ncbi:MAG: ATP-binding protein [Candidatus Micrarchaeota archaeon]